MYIFKDTIPQEHSNTSTRRASDDVYLHEYNKYLTDILPNLKIISADGRSSAKVKINSADKSGDGSIFLSRKFESLTIKLKCKLFAKDINDYNNHINVMHANLHVGKMKFSFHDERDFWRNGVFSNIEVEEGTLKPIITFDIVCSDPFKYKEWTFDNGKIPLGENYKYLSSAWVDLGIKEDNGLYQPKKIVVEYPLNSSVVSEGILIEACDQNGKVIKTIKTLPYSEWRQQNKIEIYFKSDNGFYMFINGYANNSYLDISSNIADFGVSKDGFIRIKNTDITQAYAYCLIKNL